MEHGSVGFVPRCSRKAWAIKREQIDATGATRFVTSCGQCRITLEMGARQAKWGKPTESLLELVADNLVD